MKTGSDNLNVVYIGKYKDSKILSGPEKTAKRIFEIHASKNRTSFIQYFFDGRRHGLAKKLFGREISQLNENASVYTLGLFRIIPLLFKLKPDVIHIITYERFAVFVYIYKFLTRVKIIYNEHGVVAYENSVIKKAPLLYRKKDKFCEWLYLKYSDKIVFFSERSIDIAQEFFKVNESRVIILSNGIDDEFHLRADRKTADNGRKIKAVILNNSKYGSSGAAFLIDALLKSEIPIELFVVGERINLNNLSIILNNTNTMIAAELTDFYKDKDIFLSLNKYNTFSIATVEAMASGLIPVVTEETGMSRFIIEGENGFTVQYGDTEKLLNTLSEVSGRAELRCKLSAQCSKIYDILAWPEIYESYRNLYESIRL